MAATLHARSGILRHSSWDGLLIALSGLHAALLLIVPSVPLVAIGLWWNANTISHNFIHSPFFRSRRINRLYALFLSALLGVPQSLWRERHLRHHAGKAPRFAINRRVAFELIVIAAAWTVATVVAPRTFGLTYLPGLAIGLALCELQGHFEHVRGTTSHYGRLYNWLFFNDGYHVEHHDRPGDHWTTLRTSGHRDAASSRWPPVLRWMEMVNLDQLERFVLRSPALQQFVLRRHEHAFRKLLPQLESARRVLIVGGGLFPRTALILRKLLPNAALTIVDADAGNLETAQSFVGDGIELVHATFDPHCSTDYDLVIVPLAFAGDRDAIYQAAPARQVVVHDWVWSRHGQGSLVSWFLMKRLNLVSGPAKAGPYGCAETIAAGPYGSSHALPGVGAGFSRPISVQK